LGRWWGCIALCCHHQTLYHLIICGLMAIYFRFLIFIVALLNILDSNHVWAVHRDRSRSHTIKAFPWVPSSTRLEPFSSHWLFMISSTTRL
jgi:hypothetical protein